jgi:folate-binding protein YgfZ
MHDEWRAFLAAQGAEIADDEVRGYTESSDTESARAALLGDVLADVSYVGLVAVGGPDAARFLQNQLTGDVRALSPETSQLSGYCTNKGRLVATFRLFLRDGRYYMRLPREVLEPTVQRLRTFVLRSKVAIDDISDELVGIGLSGPGAEALAREVLDDVPRAAGGVRVSDSLTALRIAGPHPRFELLSDVGSMREIWGRIAERAVRVGAGAWRLLDILAGVPTIRAATVEAFVPQMVNYQLVGGVSFTKGCYPGQEVVARMKYLGQLKRRMYRAHVESPALPAPGAKLYAPGAGPGQSSGTVVVAAPAPEGGCEMLAVIQIADVESGSVRLGDAGGPELSLRALPYAFEEPRG